MNREARGIILGAIMATVVITAMFAAIWQNDTAAPLGVCTDPCPHRELVTDGCDKHGRNCAAIYICHDEKEKDDDRKVNQFPQAVSKWST